MNVVESAYRTMNGSGKTGFFFSLSCRSCVPLESIRGATTSEFECLNPSNNNRSNTPPLKALKMATNRKPVIVLINGGYHLPIHYYPLAEKLQQVGYGVALPRHVSVGLDDSILDKTWEHDAQAARVMMQPHLDAGRELIVVGHSYGCIVATAVVEGNTVDDRRAKGLKGGVKAVLYIAGFAYAERGISPATSFVSPPASGSGSGSGGAPAWWCIEASY